MFAWLRRKKAPAAISWEVPAGPRTYDRIVRGLAAFEARGVRVESVRMTRAQYEQMKKALPSWMLNDRRGVPLYVIAGKPITIVEESKCSVLA